MALVSKFSYQRLKNEEIAKEAEEERAIRRMSVWSRFRKLTGKKRPKVRILGLRRLLGRKTRFLSAVRVLWKKALKRLKKSQAHLMSDLFAGNYLFMQVTPVPFKYVGRSFMGHDLDGFSSSYSLGRTAL